MILRKKPASVDWFADELKDPRCREEETEKWHAINNPFGTPGFRTDAIRFQFDCAFSRNDDTQRFADIAVDVTWNDVLKVIRALAIVTRHSRYKMKGRPDEDNVLSTQQEETILTAFSALAKQMGIIQTEDSTTREARMRAMGFRKTKGQRFIRSVRPRSRSSWITSLGGACPRASGRAATAG